MLIWICFVVKGCVGYGSCLYEDNVVMKLVEVVVVIGRMCWLFWLIFMMEVFFEGFSVFSGCSMDDFDVFVVVVGFVEVFLCFIFCIMINFIVFMVGYKYNVILEWVEVLIDV